LPRTSSWERETCSANEGGKFGLFLSRMAQ
jgi:hypothetical protein